MTLRLIPRVIACGSVLLALHLRLAAQPTTARELNPEDLIDLPGFGVLLPPVPNGFVRDTDTGRFLFSGIVEKWRPAAGGRTEQILLMWRVMYVAFDMAPEQTNDLFHDAAVNPRGSVRPDADDFPKVAREIEVPHEHLWPTRRFTVDKPDPNGFVRTEAIAANNVFYILIHVAPERDSREGRDAFDAIAAGLHFRAPATLGNSLHVGDLRMNIPNAKDVSILRPEPFRFGEGMGGADDLTIFTHRYEPPLDSWDSEASIVFSVGTREVPKDWIARHDQDRLDQPPAWSRDEPRLRVSQPETRKLGRSPICFYVAGAELADHRWLWTLLRISRRAVDDAGGDTAIAKLLESTLKSAEVGGK